MEQELDFGNDASKTLTSGVPKNFRQQADMEAFYRFVHENDLREDALRILDKVREQRALQRSARKPKN
jgi:hypothetical protein